MAEFINLDTDFFDHIKTVRLVKRLGRGSEVLPIRLWCYAGKYHAESGRLTGYSPQEIETAVLKWWGTPGKAMEAMLETGFLDQEVDAIVVHDWKEMNGHIEAFRVRAKTAAEARWAKIRADAQALGKQSPTYLPTDLPTDLPKTPSGWDEFWEAYPKKTAKKAAFRAWEKLKPDESLKAAILLALEQQRASEQWSKDGGKFIPFPATWLNGRRWEDHVEPPQPKPGEDGYQVTDVDKVIAGFRDVKGIPRDDVNWREVMWERQKPEAEALLKLFGGDWKAAVDCIAYTARELTSGRVLGWGWNAVMSRAPEFRAKGEKELA